MYPGLKTIAAKIIARDVSTIQKHTATHVEAGYCYCRLWLVKSLSMVTPSCLFLVSGKKRRFVRFVKYVTRVSVVNTLVWTGIHTNWIQPPVMSGYTKVAFFCQPLIIIELHHSDRTTIHASPATGAQICIDEHDAIFPFGYCILRTGCKASRLGTMQAMTD